MLKITLFSFSLFVFTSADTIDKKKILEIIKAAKQHKSVPILNKTKVTKKKIASTQPILVYRKKERIEPVVYRKKDASKKTQLMKVNYGSLPTLPPSSLELRRKFYEEQQARQTNVHFKTPIQNRNKKINTQARRIKFF